ncbi:hypothetical protein ACUV84_042841 [Puccinellia chinampoensis]
MVPSELSEYPEMSQVWTPYSPFPSLGAVVSAYAPLRPTMTSPDGLRPQTTHPSVEDGSAAYGTERLARPRRRINLHGNITGETTNAGPRH